MNKKEAIELIKEEVAGKGQDPEYDADFSKLENAGFKIDIEEQVGGEKQGEHYHVVLKLTKDGEKTFVKCDAAYYMSYEGTTWEGGEVYEVEKRKVEVEQWASK